MTTVYPRVPTVLPPAHLPVARLNSVTLHYMESCVGCGSCAPWCPYYYVDEEFAPVEKAELVRQVLRRRYTAAGILAGRVVGARMPRTEEELWELLRSAYRCADCGFCYIACMYGIDSGVMMMALRRMLYEAGVAPTIMKVLARFEGDGLYKGHPAVKSAWEAFLKEAEAPVGRRGARVLLAVTLMDITLTRDAVLNTIKVLKRVGEDFTLPEVPFGVRPPFGAIAGDVRAQRDTIKDLVAYAESLSPRLAVFIDGGYVYPQFRFEATNILRRPLGFQVLHVTELFAEYVREGRLRLKPLGIRVAWHDPCHLARRGGVIEEPREVLRKFTDYRDLPGHGEKSWCCGGGAGIMFLSEEFYRRVSQLLGTDITAGVSPRESALLRETEEALRRATLKKAKDVRRSGVQMLVTACPACIETLRAGLRFHKVDVGVEHVSNLVAKALE